MAVALAAAGCSSADGSSSRESGESSPSANDPEAAEDLSNAATAMQEVTGYRFDAIVGDAPVQIQLVGEFQAPDRLHETITIAGAPSGAVVFIGADAFVQDPATGTWENRVENTATAVATDLRSAFTALTNAEGVTRRATTYSFEIPAADARGLVGSDVTGVVEGSAVIEGGLVTTLVYRATVGGRPVEVRVTYTDIGSAPPVEEPVTG